MTALMTSARETANKRIVAPLTNLLRTGASPRRLAWSLAVGFAAGVNPLLGSTTFVALLAALVFRLNIVASQIANHLAYPLELILFFVFIRIGDKVFHTPQMPFTRDALLQAIRQQPWQTTKLLWTWEWHALIVWFAFALFVTPVLALVLTPLLERLLREDEDQTPEPCNS